MTAATTTDAQAATPNPVTEMMRNVFNEDFLGRCREIDDTSFPVGAEFAGPWRVERVPFRLHGATMRNWSYAVFSEDQSWSKNAPPEHLLTTREMAVTFAAALPCLEPTPRYRLSAAIDPAGFALEFTGNSGYPEIVGRLRKFDGRITDVLNVTYMLISNPSTLAYLLEAAGPEVLAKAGAIFGRRLLGHEEELHGQAAEEEV